MLGKLRKEGKPQGRLRGGASIALDQLVKKQLEPLTIRRVRIGNL